MQRSGEETGNESRRGKGGERCERAWVVFDGCCFYAGKSALESVGLFKKYFMFLFILSTLNEGLL